MPATGDRTSKGANSNFEVPDVNGVSLRVCATVVTVVETVVITVVGRVVSVTPGFSGAGEGFHFGDAHDNNVQGL